MFTHTVGVSHIDDAWPAVGWRVNRKWEAEGIGEEDGSELITCYTDEYNCTLFDRGIGRVHSTHAQLWEREREREIEREKKREIEREGEREKERGKNCKIDHKYICCWYMLIYLDLLFVNCKCNQSNYYARLHILLIPKKTPINLW